MMDPVKKAKQTPREKTRLGGATGTVRGTGAASRKGSALSSAPSVSVRSHWVHLVPWVCLHLAVGLIPLAISDFTWLGFSMPLTFDAYDAPKVFLLQVLTLVSAAAWGWEALTLGPRLRRSWIFWLLLALLGWTALATAFSINVPTALLGKARRLEGVVTFVCYAWLFFLAVQELRTPERLRSLARTLVLAASVVAAYGLAQYFGHDLISRESLPFDANRAFSTFGNPDLLGGYLMFPLPLALVLAWTERRTVWKVLYWVSFVLVVGAWVTAFVRGAWIGGLVALAFLAVLAVVLRSRPSPVDTGFVVAGAGTALAFGLRSLGSGSEITNVASRFRSILAFGEGSAVTRFEIWQAALAAIKRRPLFGYGPDTFRLVFPRFKPAAYVRDAGYQSVADNSHNYILQSAVGLGVPGMLLLYGLWASVLVTALPSVLRRDEPEVALLRGGFWAACVGYLVHLLFGISVSGSSTLLWISLGVLVAPGAVEVVKAAPAWGRWVCYPLAALAGLGLAVSLSFFAADHYYLVSQASAGTDAQVPAAERAVRLDPFLVAYRTNLAQAHLDQEQRWSQLAATLVDGAASDAAANARREYIAAVDGFQRAIDFAPWEYDHYPNLAAVYLAGGNYAAQSAQKALAAARQGLEVSPNDPNCRVLAASALQSLGRIDEAIALTREAAVLDPRFAEPHALLGDLYRDKGETAAARREYQTAAALDVEGRLAGWLQQAIGSLEGTPGGQ